MDLSGRREIERQGKMCTEIHERIPAMDQSIISNFNLPEFTVDTKPAQKICNYSIKVLIKFQLRRELANKQAEVDSLLHEKQNIWEQQAGAAAHYDRELIENYEERITQLEGACEKQRRELARWFGKLCEPTANGWLPGVLEHLKSECEQLRAEVLSRGAAQLASAAQLRELRRKLALLAADGAAARPRASRSPADPHTTGDINTESSAPKVPAPVKSKPTLDDVKKKVSFN